MPREFACLQLAQSLKLEQVNGNVSAVESEASVSVGHIAVAFKRTVAEVGKAVTFIR